MAKADDAMEKLATHVDVDKLTVDDIRSLLLSKGANPDNIPLGQWTRNNAINAFVQFFGENIGEVVKQLSLNI